MVAAKNLSVLATADEDEPMGSAEMAEARVPVRNVPALQSVSEQELVDIVGGLVDEPLKRLLPVYYGADPENIISSACLEIARRLAHLRSAGQSTQGGDGIGDPQSIGQPSAAARLRLLRDSLW
jgi:hypothetical protein